MSTDDMTSNKSERRNSERRLSMFQEPELSARELQELEAAFSIVDRDKSGKIEIDELEEVLDLIGIKSSKKELKEMLKMIDNRDKNGKIGFLEFRDFMREYGRSRSEKRNAALETFRLIDENGNGRIEKIEIKMGLVHCGIRMSDKNLDKLMDKLDRNHDDKIDYEEFVKEVMKYSE